MADACEVKEIGTRGSAGSAGPMNDRGGVQVEGSLRCYTDAKAFSETLKMGDA